MINSVERGATRVIRLGPPYDQRPTPPKIENYNESRSLSKMEDDLWVADMDFSFSTHFRFVSARFSNHRLLNSLDSGCGNGIGTRGIKTIWNQLGRESKVTGITMAKRNIRPAIAMGVKELLVGKLQKYAEKTKPTPRYQFVLDFCGPVFYDNPVGQIPGSTVIPIYSELLVPGGTALLTMSKLRERRKTQSRDSILRLMQEYNFRVLEVQDMYALVEKRAA